MSNLIKDSEAYKIVQKTLFKMFGSIQKENLNSNTELDITTYADYTIVTDMHIKRIVKLWEKMKKSKKYETNGAISYVINTPVYSREKNNSQFSHSLLIEFAVVNYITYFGNEFVAEHYPSTEDMRKEIRKSLLNRGYTTVSVDSNFEMIYSTVLQYMGYKMISSTIKLRNYQLTHSDYNSIEKLIRQNSLITLKFKKSKFTSTLIKRLKYLQYLFRVSFKNKYLAQNNFTMVLMSSEVSKLLTEFAETYTVTYYQQYLDGETSIEDILQKAEKHEIPIFMSEKIAPIEEKLLSILSEMKIQNFILSQSKLIPTEILRKTPQRELINRVGMKYITLLQHKIMARKYRLNEIVECLDLYLKEIKEDYFLTDIKNYVEIKNNLDKIKSTIPMQNWLKICNYYTAYPKTDKNKEVAISIVTNYYPSNYPCICFEQTANQGKHNYKIILAFFGIYVVNENLLTSMTMAENTVNSLYLTAKQISQLDFETCRENFGLTSDLIDYVKQFLEEEYYFVTEGAFLNEKYTVTS